MADKIQLRRDTLSNWQSRNPVLSEGELALISLDENNPSFYTKWKCGNGVSNFNSLPMQNLETFGFTGQIDDDPESGMNPNNLFTDGVYIKQSTLKGQSQYILYVRTVDNIKYQMRMYYSDGNKNIIALRSYDSVNSVWSNWNSQEIATFDRIFGFDGNKANAKVDTLTTPGTYIQTASASDSTAQAYILTVRVINGNIHQSRERYTDGGLFVSEYRERIGEVWGTWTQKQFAWKDELFVYDGYIDTSNPNANNYIDKVKTQGIYRRATGGQYPIIYFVKINNNVVYQTQLYYNDGNQLVFRVRNFNEESNSWSAWTYDVFSFNVQTFEIANVDNVKSNGTYICSASGGGILQVCAPVAPYSNNFTFKQVWMKPNDVTGISWGVRYWSAEYTQWTEWCWNNLDTNELSKNTLSKEAVAFDYSNYPTTIGSYIRRSDKTIQANAPYRIVVIPVADLPKGQMFLTTACQGGGIIPISYWNSNDITQPSNYRGRDVLQTYNGANGAIFEGHPISPIIPSGATHMAICWSYAEYQNMTLSIYNPDQRRKAEYAILAASSYMGQRTNIYDGDAVWMYKRGAALNLVGNHSDLIIVAGQSNADGRAEKADAPQWLIDMNYKIDGYMMWNRINKRFQPWELGVNTGSYENNKNQFGFDIFFAKKYLDANPGKKLYAVKETEGGIPISPIRASGETRSACWTPKIESIPAGENSMCLQLIERLSEALQWSRDHGIVLLPQTCLWHQGEADMTETRAPYYEENLKELVAWMRGIWGTPALPFINGQISSRYDTEWQVQYSANKAFTALMAIDDYFKTVNMEGQPMLPDDVHFKAAGYEHLGYGMWDFYQTFNPIYQPASTRAAKTKTVYKDSIPTD